MWATTALAGAVFLAAGALAPSAGWAQSNPSAKEIVKSLTPNSQMGSTTRGIRMVPQSGKPASAPSVSLNVDFATGSAELTPQARQTLDQLGEALNAPQLARDRFRVEGHTDTVGSMDRNQMLSERRASSVVQYLESKFNVAPSRLHAVGMGEKDLLVPTPPNTPEQRNRRVRVVNVGS